MGYGSAGTGLMREFGGFVKTESSSSEGGKGSSLARAEMEKAWGYFADPGKMGQSLPEMTRTERQERSKMDGISKIMFDTVNGRVRLHKNNIDQIRWNIANDGRVTFKAGLSVGDINKFTQENKAILNNLTAKLNNNRGGSASKAEKQLVGLLNKFYGAKVLPSKGSLFQTAYNELGNIKNDHIAVRDMIQKKDWNSLAKFKTTKETSWAERYVKTAQTYTKGLSKGKNRAGRTNEKVLARLEKFRNNGAKGIISLNKINSNISRLNTQQALTRIRARENSVPLKVTGSGLKKIASTYNASTSGFVSETVKYFKENAGLKLTGKGITSQLKKTTQPTRYSKI